MCTCVCKDQTNNIKDMFLKKNQAISLVTCNNRSRINKNHYAIVEKIDFILMKSIKTPWVNHIFLSPSSKSDIQIMIIANIISTMHRFT